MPKPPSRHPGAENLIRLRDQAIFVDQTTDASLSSLYCSRSTGSGGGFSTLRHEANRNAANGQPYDNEDR
jgi:hypothetical protein